VQQVFAVQGQHQLPLVTLLASLQNWTLESPVISRESERYKQERQRHLSPVCADHSAFLCCRWFLPIIVIAVVAAAIADSSNNDLSSSFLFFNSYCWFSNLFSQLADSEGRETKGEVERGLLACKMRKATGDNLCQGMRKGTTNSNAFSIQKFKIIKSRVREASKIGIVERRRISVLHACVGFLCFISCAQTRYTFII
jgi:hypothetical protein